MKVNRYRLVRISGSLSKGYSCEVVRVRDELGASRGSHPYAVNRGVAEGAGTVFNAVLGNRITTPFDHCFAATPAGGILSSARNIPFVDIPQPFCKSYLAGTLERLFRGSRGIEQLVGGEKGTYMPGCFNPKIVLYKLRYGPELVVTVVVSRDYKGRKLDPDAEGLVGLYCVNNTLQLGPANLPIKIPIETFEINVGSIEVMPDGFERLLLDIAIGDEIVIHTFFLRKLRSIEGVFIKYCRLCIGVGYAFAARLLRPLHHFGRRHFLTRNMPFVPRHLRDFMVLAMAATKIASRRRYGEGPGTGKKMEERFFLDGINVEGAGEAVDKGVQNTVLVFPHTAKPSLSLGNMAVVPAEAAMDLRALQFFIKQGFSHGLPPKHYSHNLIHSPCREKFYLSFHVLGNLDKLTHVLFRNNDLLYPCP